MTTFESFWRSLGLLLSERLHIITAGTVQTAGVTCRWEQDLTPVGERAVAAGELVELHVTLDELHPIADTARIRFDILEFDWLFCGGFDDPVSCLKPATADPPDGDFTIIERIVTTATTSAELPTLRAVVDDYRFRHADDYERAILVVTDAASGVTDVIAWWRAVRVEDVGDRPSLYFVAEIPGRRSSSSVPLTVTPAGPGVIMRLTGQLRDAEPSAGPDPQPVPDAVVAVAGRTARTSADGEFILDGRLPLGASAVTITRSGIDTRTLTVTVAQRADHGYEAQVLDADAAGAELDRGSLDPGADEQAMVTAILLLRAKVHRLRGQVTWPRTWAPDVPLPLAGRRVCAVPLAAGAALPQRPATSRDWEVLRSRPDVLRSGQPGRFPQGEPTDASGAFEISFFDLTPGQRWLLWVEGTDPRPGGTSAFDVIIRTVATPRMRRLAFPADPAHPGRPLQPEQTDRGAVDSTYNLLGDSVAGATEVLRVEATPLGGVAVHRPGRADPAGIDANPAAGTEILLADDARWVQGLRLEVLPLVPVFEPADRQGEQARRATVTLHEQLDAFFPEGHLVGGLRWVLDARRGPTGTWDDASACAALEQTLLTHPALAKARIDSGTWPWWRADTVSAADFARIDRGAAFAGRRLIADLVPILAGPSPRLLALFPGRHVHLSPGHGVYAQPPVGYDVHSNRPDWAATAVPPTPVQNWAGEDENAGGLAIAVRAVAVANGATVTSSREADPTRLGWVHDPGPPAGLIEVDPVAHPDYPRLWQQNAYYWIAAEWDPAHAGAEIVRGHEVVNPALVGNADPIDAAGINRRLELFRREANGAGVDMFLAFHTNASGPAVHGYLVMYLDIRATPTTAAPGQAPAPGQAAFAEQNALGEDCATRLGRALIARAVMPAAPGAPTDAARTPGVRSYFTVGGNTTRELATTVHHFATPLPPPPAGRVDMSPHGLRSVTDTVPPTLRDPSSQPDVPIGYLELGFHSSPEDASLLSQGWFRYVAGIAISEATADIIGDHSFVVAGDDLRALLTRTFGAIPSVTGLAAPAGPLTPADATAWVQAVTGTPLVVPDTRLADVVATLKTAREVVTRVDLARRVADATAARAGWSAADPDQADDRSGAAYGPVLRALGGPPAAGVPDISAVPRAAMPATRGDAAAVLGAALGLRPATLATVTTAVNGVVLFPAANPEDPEAFVAEATLAATETALGQLQPGDVWRLGAARLTDARGTARAVPYLVVPGEEVVLAVETVGTAWPGPPGDVRIVVTRAGAIVATVACATRTAAGFTSAPWAVPAPGVAGAQIYDVSARVQDPAGATVSLAAVPLSLEVAAR